VLLVAYLFPALQIWNW